MPLQRNFLSPRKKNIWLCLEILEITVRQKQVIMLEIKQSEENNPFETGSRFKQGEEKHLSCVWAAIFITENCSGFYALCPQNHIY